MRRNASFMSRICRCGDKRRAQGPPRSTETRGEEPRVKLKMLTSRTMQPLGGKAPLMSKAECVLRKREIGRGPGPGEKGDRMKTPVKMTRTSRGGA